MGLPSGVIKHGWLENHRTEWRFRLLGKSLISIFSMVHVHAMFDYRREFAFVTEFAELPKYFSCFSWCAQTALNLSGSGE